MRSCLPISTTSISLVGLLSRSTMLPASLAAWVPVFIATPTSACASAGASLVPSPVMATRCPRRLLGPQKTQLVFGRGLGEEVIDPGLGGNCRCRQRIISGDHDGLDAHRAEFLEPLGQAALDDVLEINDAQHFIAGGNHERRAAGLAHALDGIVDLARNGFRQPRP